jgi:hypothetical protein
MHTEVRAAFQAIAGAAMSSIPEQRVPGYSGIGAMLLLPYVKKLQR